MVNQTWSRTRISQDSKKNGIKSGRTPGKHADLPSRGIGGNKHAAYLPETKGHR